MSNGYSDIFFDWLLKELRDVNNFTLIADKNTLVHRKHEIKITSFRAFSYELIIKIELNYSDISVMLPELMKTNYRDLYSKIRKHYLDAYDEADKIRCKNELDKFVVNNLMNY